MLKKVSQQEILDVMLALENASKAATDILIDRFAEEQPVIAEYLAELANNAHFTPVEENFLFSNAFIVWRTLCEYGEKPAQSTGINVIIDIEKQNIRTYGELFKNTAGHAIMLGKTCPDYPQPELFKFLLHLISDPMTGLKESNIVLITTALKSTLDYLCRAVPPSLRDNESRSKFVN